VNERNRVSKLARFGFFPTSEDAVSWVVFSHLLRTGQLTTTFQQAGLVGPEAGSIRPELLLWGAAVDPGPRGVDIQSSLRQICLGLGESSTSLSEPDVIVDFGDCGVVFIEVKHRSGNDVKKVDYAGWAKYADHPSAGWASAAVRESGCYELARNWLLMSQLAGGRPGTLVNLGPETLFVGTAGAALAKFTAAIATNDRRRFRTLSWTRFRRAIPSSVAHDWLSDFFSSWGVGIAPQANVP
jgi:hypothetical protein